MRHLFDQYEGLENRLTHALACCLWEDRSLLARFLDWSLGNAHPPVPRLEVLEQCLPGDAQCSEKEAEGRGLPDLCLHDGDAWCLIVENKVTAQLTAEQLARHRATLRRRGFSATPILTLTPQADTHTSPSDSQHRRWTDVYRWCRKQTGGSEWAKRLAEYLEVVDMQLTTQDYERDWTLTEFTGFPFGKQQPYNYPQAKQVLSLAMKALREREDLRERLNIATGTDGRARITGREATGVWDVLRFQHAPGGNVNLHPHLTLVVDREFVLLLLVLPNGMKREYRRQLCELGTDGFMRLVREVLPRLDQVLAGAGGWVPWLELVQRHYPSRSAEAVVDTRLEFDLRTLETGGAGTGVKRQPLWTRSAFETFCDRAGANVQLALGVKFPYGVCPALRRPEALDHLAAAWMAFGPVIDIVFAGNAG